MLPKQVELPRVVVPFRVDGLVVTVLGDVDMLECKAISISASAM